MVPTHQLAESATLRAIRSCAGLSALPAAAQSQLRISLVSSVNILALFQHELNTNPVIQLGQLLSQGHTLKQACYVRTCFRLHVSRKSRGIWERIFPLCIQNSFFAAPVPLKYAWQCICLCIHMRMSTFFPASHSATANLIAGLF